MRKREQKINFVVLLLICGSFWFGGETSANSESGSIQNKVAENVKAFANLEPELKNNNLTQTNEIISQAIASPIPPAQSEVLKIINRYIAGVARVSGASEYKEARKIIYGDVDGDRDKDAVVQFTIEGEGGGNYYAFYLAVFGNENGKFKLLTDEVVGGKLKRNVNLRQIKNGKIYIDTQDYDKDDGACCPSIKGKTIYILKNKKLKEIKENKKNR